MLTSADMSYCLILNDCLQNIFILFFMHPGCLLYFFEVKTDQQGNHTANYRSMFYRTKDNLTITLSILTKNNLK